MSSNINFLVQTQYNLLTLLFSSMRKIKDDTHLSHLLCQKRKRKRKKKRLFFVKKKNVHYWWRYCNHDSPKFIKM